MKRFFPNLHVGLFALIFLYAVAFSQYAFAGCPGCCSSHGGVSNSCSGSGRVYCNDGTISPSCTCSACGVSSGSSPTCSLTASPTAITLGSSSTLTAYCSPTASSLWTNSGLSSNSSSGVVYPTATTTYGVRGSNSVGTGSLASATVSVTAPSPTPVCTLTATPSTIVLGGAAILTASCNPAATNYVWSNSGFSSSASSGSVYPSVDTTYSVSGINAGGAGTVASVTVLMSTLQSCTGGQSWNGTSCVCPTGQTMVDGQCFKPAAATACGVVRWSIKTATDSEAIKIDTRNPSRSSIAELAAFNPPISLPANSRVDPVELSTYIVDATLTDYRMADDSDYHLVIADAAGRTMIVELPHPDCVATTGVLRNAIIATRNSFDSRLRATSTFKTTSIPVKVYGVGFFDYLH